MDTVINHMVYSNLEGYGTAGSYYNSNKGVMSFPGVPYVESDFNCCLDTTCSDGARQCQSQSCNIESYHDPIQVSNLLVTVKQYQIVS